MNIPSMSNDGPQYILFKIKKKQGSRGVKGLRPLQSVVSGVIEVVLLFFLETLTYYKTSLP